MSSLTPTTPRDDFNAWSAPAMELRLIATVRSKLVRAEMPRPPANVTPAEATQLVFEALAPSFPEDAHKALRDVVAGRIGRVLNELLGDHPEPPPMKLRQLSDGKEVTLRGCVGYARDGTPLVATMYAAGETRWIDCKGFVWEYDGRVSNVAAYTLAEVTV